MCGIAGLMYRDGRPVHERLVAGMTASLAHRGPDGSGVHVEPGVGLGHSRLSIIDLEGGAQPLSNEDGSIWVTFNGEIYNHAELRSGLVRRGHRFRSRSDTEVLVHLYEEYGEDLVEQLHGMFAFGIWDRRSRRLVLARDRLGQKPLYVADDGRRVAFASELKALAGLDRVDRSIDPDALDAYLTFGYVPAPLTIHRGVRKLQPAEVRVCDPSGSSSRRYWDLRFAPREEPFERSVERFDDLLRQTVRDRLMAEVPLGAFLSGGIDSSLVVAHMQALNAGAVHTISVGFGSTDDEVAHAAAVAGHLGTSLREVTVRPDATALPMVTDHFDEPFADPSALPTWWLSQAAREHVTVALSGDGGDEAFGGYSPRYPAHLIEARLRSAAGPLASGLGQLGAHWPRAGWIPRPLRLGTLLQNIGRDPVDAYRHDMARLRPERRGDLLEFGPRDAANSYSARWFSSLFDDADAAGASDPLSRVLYVDMRSFLAEGVLVKVDRASMAHGLEVRSPLLDHRIYELAATLPVDAKVRGLAAKRVMRAALARYVPRAITERPKQGFDPPRASWLRGTLRPLVEEALESPRSGLVGIVRRRQARKVWDRFVGGGPDESPLFWTLLCFDLWSRGQTPAAEVATDADPGPRVVAAGGS